MIKNKKLTRALLFISIVSIMYIIFNLSKKEAQIPKGGSIGVNYKGLKPGEDYNEELINEKLGYPTISTSEGEIKRNLYRSSSEYRFNQISINNNKIEIIKEVVNPNDKINSDTIRQKYGIANEVLYEKASDSYFDLYVYNELGVAYIGHEDGTVLEIWYFMPTNIDNFIKEHASNYQKEPFTSQTSH